MPDYVRQDARSWARENLFGVAGVTLPTFTQDLKRLNRGAIAHDVELLASLGFSYTLVMSETNITPAENAEFTAVAREASAGRVRLFFHAAWGTLQDNIEAVRLAEQAGADLALLSYPPQFWPTAEKEIYEYTKAFCDATQLGVMLFPIPTWGFERIHPAGMSVDLIRHMVDTIPNVVAIKAEQGNPHIAGIVEMYHHFRDDVVISCPIEHQCIPLMDHLELQFSGTSNTQWMSDYYPRAFAKARGGDWEAAMDLYWAVQPARLANEAVSATFAGVGVINRTAWKYMDWLAGFNGGPLRAPAMRIPDRFMAPLRTSLKTSGLPVTSDPDAEFMAGRNPE